MLASLMLPRLGAGRMLAAALSVGALLAPVVGASLVFSRAPHASAVVLARVLFLALLGLSTAAIARARGGVRALTVLACGIGVVASLHAIVQGLTGFASQTSAAQDLPENVRALVLARLGSGRVFGPFLLPASFGGAIAITLPLTIALALGAAGRRRAAWAGASLVQAVALLWSVSLGAWIALAAAAAIALTARSLRTPRARRALGVGLVVAALVVASGMFARARLLPAPGSADKPLTYRSGNWIVAAEMIRDHPWFGTGPGTFGEMFPAYRRPGMNESRYAHSTYLQLVAELGIGVAPFLVLVPFAGAALVRRGARSAIGTAASIGALAFLLQNLVDFTFYQPGVGVLFVVAVALASCGGVDRRGEESGSADASPALGSESGARAPSALARWTPAHALVVAASLAAGAFLVASGISDLSRERAAFAHELGGGEEASLLHRSIRWDPLDPEPRGDLAALLAARVRNASGAPSPGDVDDALAQARAAVRRDPQTAYRRQDLARIELMKGHPAEAWVQLSRAPALYPMKETYRKDLADLESRLFATEAPPAGSVPVPGPAAPGPVGRGTSR